jgi:nitroimidazol reductase NimA-like FMN-containing flavoprotein (pyridoxamine 5'-phosphate oxidase superfamily)
MVAYGLVISTKGACTVINDAQPRLAELDESECLRLISPGGVGRLAFVGQYDLTVLPVNYRMLDGTILFRTDHDSPMDRDLRTGIKHAEYKVAFEIDHLDGATREGWSVLLQGSAHHVDAEDEQNVAEAAGVDPWAGGAKSHFIRITPVRITGRRIRADG